MMGVKFTQRAAMARSSTQKMMFSLKAAVLDFSLFTLPLDNNNHTSSSPSSPSFSHHQSNRKSNSAKQTVNIEGVTDVLTKYRAKLREKNIHQSSLSRDVHSSDAQLLYQAKQTLQTLKTLPNSDVESPINDEMDKIMHYIEHRGIKLYISYTSSVEFTSDDKDLLAHFSKSPLQLNVLKGLSVDNALASILTRNKIDSREVIVISNDAHTLQSCKTKNVITCQYGPIAHGHDIFSLRASYQADSSDDIQKVIEDNNGVSFL